MSNLPSAGAVRQRISTPSSSFSPAAPNYAVYANAAELLAERGAPDAPIHALRPHILARQAAFFVNEFPGTPMYAVKVNPDPLVIDTLAANGIRTFDVASMAEIKLIAERVPQMGNTPEMFFMHPVKPRHAIRRAYAEFGVRDYSLDSVDELQKILEETNNAADLGLHIRLALPKGDAFHGLSNKFGATPELAITLLQLARARAGRVGLCFHVGSQMMNPAAYTDALAKAMEVVTASGVAIDSIDVGGGYPVTYAGMKPPALSQYMKAIRAGLRAAKLLAAPKQSEGGPKHIRVLGEPGRALVAESGRLICRVDARKDDYLYINDGGYGSLFDAAFTGLVYPAQLHRTGKASKKLAPFKLYGPTCDSLDVMPGPFMLPSDMREGDIIEFYQTGAYTYSLQSRFNGFYGDEVVVFEE